MYGLSYKPNVVNNGFKRNVRAQSIQKINSIKLKADNKLQLVDVSVKDAYLFDILNSQFLIQNFKLDSERRLPFVLRDNKIPPEEFYALLLPPHAFLIATREKEVIDYDFKNDTCVHYHLPFFFSRACLISNGNFAIRKYYRDSTGSDYELVKYSLKGNQISKTTSPFDRNNDGGFSTEGLLHYDSVSNSLVYVFYFSNRFLCMDTNLNILYPGHTIDTFSRPQINVKRFGSGVNLGYSMSAPPKIINKLSCVNNGKLYIASGIRADNESEKTFLENSVVDIYLIKDGSYQYSFYIPDTNKEKILEFRISNNHIYTLTAHYLSTFNIEKD